MDFTSIKANPLWGPIRIIVGLAIGIVDQKGWIPASILAPGDVDIITALVITLLGVWSLWQSQHSAKQAAVITATAVAHTVRVQTPREEPMRAAEQKAVIAMAQSEVKGMTEEEKTAVLNKSQVH